MGFAAELARMMPETKATNTNVKPGGGRVYVDIGKSNERKRSAEQVRFMSMVRGAHR